MDGKSMINLYLDFRLNYVVEFYKELLPKSYFEKKNFEFFKKVIKKNYIDIFFDNNTFDKLVPEEDVKKKLIKILKSNNITKEELQQIYLTFFKNELIESWENKKLSDKELKLKNKCDIYATTIFITLEFDKYIKFDVKKKIAFKEAMKNILLTNLLNEEVIKNLHLKEKELSKLFNDTQNKNLKFLKSDNNDIFKLKYLDIKSIDDKDTNMYLSQLDYSIKDLKNFGKKEVTKILNSRNNIFNFKKIEIELVSMDLLKTLKKDISKKVFIDIPDKFLNKSNISFIEKNLYVVKESIFLNINYDQLLEYNDLINNLKEEGFNITFTKGKSDVSFKKMYKIKYFFMNQENTITFDKTLAELKLGKIDAIVTNTSTNTQFICDKGINYYMQ